MVDLVVPKMKSCLLIFTCSNETQSLVSTSPECMWKSRKRTWEISINYALNSGKMCLDFLSTLFDPSGGQSQAAAQQPAAPNAKTCV